MLMIQYVYINLHILKLYEIWIIYLKPVKYIDSLLYKKRNFYFTVYKYIYDSYNSNLLIFSCTIKCLFIKTRKKIDFLSYFAFDTNLLSLVSYHFYLFLPAFYFIYILTHIHKRR